MAVAAFIGELSIAICFLRFGLYSRWYSMQLVDTKRRQYFSYNRKIKNYVYTICWKAQKDLPVTCGSNFAMSKNAVNNYLQVLSTNVTNAVLLIKP